MRRVSSMNRTFALLALSAAVAVSAGCGKKHRDQPKPADPPAAAASQPIPAEPQRTVAPGAIEPAQPAAAKTEAAMPAVPAAPAASEPAPFTGITAAHNEWRAKVGVAPLKWSDTVAKYAQEWADSLKAKNCEMHHRSSRQYGENLAWGGMSLTADAVVNMWAAEINDYNYASNGCLIGKTCLHYTQIVWRDSTELGCGMANCGDREIWVCNYNPPGNSGGRKPY